MFNITTRKYWVSFIALSLGHFSCAYAGDIDIRHGAARPDGLNARIEGGITITTQHADDSRIDDEAFASIDLVATVAAGAGEWVIYVEGNTSPQNDAVSTLIGEANADAGSALDRDDNGRLQISELHYSIPAFAGDLTVGLIDSTGFLDTNNVANDETTQFLGSTLVNNPTIEFPDYTLGAAYHRYNKEQAFAYTVFVGSSHGLGDNTNKSYSQLVEVDETGKGVFAAAELFFDWNNLGIRTGVWLNSADHANLDGSGDGKENNSGLYAGIDGKYGQAKWNIRLGIADDDVSTIESFASFAFEHPFIGHTVGAGITHSSLSDKATTAGMDDTLQAEAYLRYEFANNLQFTPSVQWIENSDFDSSNTSYDDGLLLVSLRLNYAF